MRNMKIGRRLALAFGAVLVILALSVAAGVWRLQELAATTRQLATVDNEKLQMAEQWRQTIELNWVRTRAAALEDDGARVKNWQADVDQTSELTTASRNRLLALVTHEESKALIARIDVAREAYRTLRAALFKRRAAGEDVTAALENDVKPLADSYIGAIRSFEDRQRAIYEESLAQAERNAVHGQRILLGSGLAALLLGSFFAFALTRSIVSPLRLAASTAQLVAQGDLSHRIVVQGRDEAAALMGALQHMQQSLNKVVAVVRSNAQEVAMASSQMAAGNNDLSARTEQQASALQETAASMEEFSATVRHNADNAQQANQLALAATAVAQKGGAVVARVVATMEDINDSSGRIGDIISVIEGIAFQTNILALNAAVEAARAGEQGRGFAVVAAEVRNLAQRSAQAAKEIKALIDTSVERVGAGTSLVAEAGRTMEDVVASIQRVTSIMGEISAASREQSAGVAQVGEAVTQMDQATQQNAALVEQGAAAAAGLQAQARQLVESVAIFKLVPAEQAVA